MAISHRLAGLKSRSLWGFVSSVRATAGRRSGWPTAHNRICVSSSSFTCPTEQLRDLRAAHAVEIVGDRELALEKAQPSRRLWCIERHDLHQRLARLGDHERLALDGAIDQLRELGLRFVDVDGDHIISQTKLIGRNIRFRSPPALNRSAIEVVPPPDPANTARRSRCAVDGFAGFTPGAVDLSSTDDFHGSSDI